MAVSSGVSKSVRVVPAWVVLLVEPPARITTLPVSSSYATLALVMPPAHQ